MAPPAFQTYQEFPSNEAALPLLALLTEHDIPYETKTDRLAVDPSFSFNATNSSFLVKLRPEDVPRVEALLEEENRRLLAEVSPEHYLFTFTNAELMNVLTKRQEWSRFDVLLAERILQERGFGTEVMGLNQLQDHREAHAPEYEESHSGWIVIGYIMALMGGFFGVLIGLHLFTHRRTRPDGSRQYAFSPEDRVHGLRIVVLSALAVAFWIAVRLLVVE